MLKLTLIDGFKLFIVQLKEDYTQSSTYFPVIYFSFPQLIFVLDHFSVHALVSYFTTILPSTSVMKPMRLITTVRASTRSRARD